MEFHYFLPYIETFYYLKFNVGFSPDDCWLPSSGLFLFQLFNFSLKKPKCSGMDFFQ